MLYSCLHSRCYRLAVSPGRCVCLYILRSVSITLDTHVTSLIYLPCPRQLVCIDIVLEAGVLFPIWPYFFLCFVRRETSRRLRCPPVSVYFGRVIGFWSEFEFDGRVCWVPCVSWGVFHSGPVLVSECRRGRVFVLSWSVYCLWYIVNCRAATGICLTY